ncbi:MAG: hypothetical protein AAFY84_02825 [Pseudomonadota bacterium]
MNKLATYVAENGHVTFIWLPSIARAEGNSVSKFEEDAWRDTLLSGSGRL